MVGNLFDLGGLADDVSALYHHLTITAATDLIASDNCQQRTILSLNVPLRPRTPPLFPPVLCDDTVEILGPRRPAKHAHRVIVVNCDRTGNTARGLRWRTR